MLNHYRTVMNAVSRCFLFLFAAFALLAPVGRAVEVDPMHYRSHVFLTGDYVLDSTPLGGQGSNPGFTKGNFTISGVPCTLGIGPSASIVPCSTIGAVPADIVSAVVYWETVYPSNYTPAQELLLRKGKFDGKDITGQPLGAGSHPVACWGFGGTIPVQRFYVADVLRNLSFDTVNKVRLANGSHTVELPSIGTSGNGQIPLAQGATLVVGFRVVVPGKPDIMPLRAFVTYAGSQNMGPRLPGEPVFSTANQVLGGFWQLAPAAAAKMTWIVGDASSKFKQTLTVNGLAPSGVNQTNPFGGAQGGGWNALTFNISDAILQANLQYPAMVQTQVQPGDNESACLSFGVILISALVRNGSNDGILNIWKTNGLHFNRGGTDVPATFGTCTEYPADCVNLPAMGAIVERRQIYIQLDWMHGTGDGTGGIDGYGTHVHKPRLEALEAVYQAFQPKNIDVFFDVGNNYQGLGKPFIIPAAYAKGGHDDDESSLACVDPSPLVPPDLCAYDVPYSVLSYKLGFSFIRDGNKLLSPPILAHMPQNRKDIFHYGLLGHSLAGPFDSTTGKPLSPDPKTTSGIADRPGGSFMVTLGGWRSDIPADDMVGSKNQQAGTIMHELGHNLNLLHGGLLKTPQCGPNYPSVMSYSNQTRLLTLPNGSAVPNFSDGLLSSFNENSLPGALGALNYKVRFYGPLGPNNTSSQAAKVHCDGSAITDGALAMRLESATVSTPDWSNGKVPAVSAFDVNFDGNGGILGQALSDQPDWSSLNLLQVSAQPMFGSISVGSISSDSGSIASDSGSVASDAGSIASDSGSIASDSGSIASDSGSIASDSGSITSDSGSIASDSGDLDYETLNSSSVDPPPSPSPDCPTCGTTATNGLTGILVKWTPPPSSVQSYNIYRCNATADPLCTPSVPPVAFRNVAGGSATPSSTDNVNDSVNAGATCPSANTCNNTFYRYSVTALVLVSGQITESGQSNTATSKVTRLFVIADSKTVTYDGTIQAVTFQVYGEVSGSLSPAAVTCTSARNVVTNFAIVCSGPATTSPTNGVTYNLPYLSNTPGTLTINQRPITVTAAASSKPYDTTTTSAAVPTITSVLGLGNGDIATWTESYDNPNVGTTHVMTPAGTVIDNNGGNNYSVTFVTINTGVITKATATIVVTPYSVTYDGNPHTATGTATGVGGADLSAGLTLTGTTHTNAGTYDGDAWSFSGGTNYNDASGTVNDAIAKATATIVVTPYSVTYDANPHTATGTATGVGGADLSASLTLTGTTHTNAGTYNGDAWSFSGGTNYNDASGTVNDAIAKATATIVVTPYSVTYNANPHTATGTATGVGGANLSASLNLGGTTHTNAGTYNGDAWSFSGGTNYNDASGTVNDVIAKANATIVVVGYNVPYDGAPHTATGTATGVGGANLSASLNLGGTTHTPVGIYPADAWSFSNANYNDAAGTVRDVIEGFTLTGNLLTPRSLHTATLFTGGPLVGKVLIAGGKSNPTLASAELFDPTAQTFSATTNPMGTARSSHTATLLTIGANAGKVLIAGGADSTGKALASAELFNPSTQSFSPSTNAMPNKAAGHTATLLSSDVNLSGANASKILFPGGGNSNAQLYDQNAGTFSSTGGMGSNRSDHSATLLPNGKVLIAGGTGNGGAVLATALLYDPKTGNFAGTASMSTKRSSHRAVLLSSGPNAGKVLVEGGWNGASDVASAELYDPATGTWAAAASLGVTGAREAHTATLLLNDGRVLVAAGKNAGTSIKTAALYTTVSPTTSAFIATGSLNYERASHTATLLSDGRVVVIGGVGLAGVSIGSAELFISGP